MQVDDNYFCECLMGREMGTILEFSCRTWTLQLIRLTEHLC